MDELLQQTASEVLDRHPAPALPMEELQALVARERAGAAPDPDRLAQALRAASSGVRVVDTDPVRLAPVCSLGWVVAPAGSRRGGASDRSLAGRLRETVRALGHSLEPGSNLALARWARLLMEERRIRDRLRPAS
jgi:hypothetical protein